MDKFYKLSEVVQKYNITARTLKFYEEMGLISSKRNRENNYRIYDESTVKVLEEILFLRKLDISTKNIKMIVETNNLGEIMKIVSAKKTQLKNEISYLIDIKERITTFISQIENQNKAKEISERCKVKNRHKVMLDTMKEIHQTGECKSLQIEEIENKTCLSIASDSKYAITEKEYSIPLKIKITAKTNDKNLILYFGGYSVIFNWECNESELRFHDQVLNCTFGIPEKGKIPKNEFVEIEWIISSDYTKVTADKNYLFYIEYSNNTEFELRSRIGAGSESDSIITIKDIIIISNYIESSSKIENKFENAVNKEERADLTKMKWRQSEHFIENGELVIFNTSDKDSLETESRYKLPIKIDLTAKVDDTNIRIYYNKGKIILNWENDRQNLIANDIIKGWSPRFSYGGYITPNEYHDISWILHTDFTALIVDGVSRFYSEDYPYIKFLKNNAIESSVRLSSAFGNTMTVKSLEISELYE